MSKISALRMINLNYNNNAIRINDEVFRLNGESTLLSLRNGGGKSVLVQMMTAPFVHKRYRDAKDRTFASYFTTNKPTFIMVEWVLDGGAGYVLTGLMVRKNQDVSEEQTEDLEIVGFINEYKAPCMQDIYHLPVIEKTKKEMNLKGFAACKQLFEAYKKDRSMEFFSYDMNHGAQSRQYFDKLKEYQINYKEWETIIKKVNLKESGLSDLFADCKDEKGLVEKWFLDAVESKLNKDKNRMKEFESIVSKYVNQYKDNRSKIERRDTIRLFRGEAQEILAQGRDYEQTSGEVFGHENRIANFIMELYRLEQQTEEDKKGVLEKTNEIGDDISRIGYEKISYDIYGQRERQSYHVSNRDMIGFERDGLETECVEFSKRLELLDCARWQQEVTESHREYTLAQEKLTLLHKKQEDLEPERNRLGGTLKFYYEENGRIQKQRSGELEAEYRDSAAAESGQKEKSERYQKEMVAAGTAAGGLKSEIASFDGEEERFNRLYEENVTRNILGEYEPAALELKLTGAQEDKSGKERGNLSRRRSLEQSLEAQKSLDRGMEDTRRELTLAASERQVEEQNFSRFEEELTERRVILRYLELSEADVFDRERIMAAAARKLKEIGQVKRSGEQELDELEKEYKRLTQGQVLELSPQFEEMLESIGVSYVYGMDWLKKNGHSSAENQELVKKHPFIPYALILSGAELRKLEKYGESVYTSSPIPIIKREDLEQEETYGDGSVISMEHLSFYVLFNDNLLDEKKLRVLILQKEEQIEKKKQFIGQKEQEYGDYFSKQERIKNQSVTAKGYKELEKKIEGLKNRLTDLTGRLEEQKDKAAGTEKQIKSLREEIAVTERSIDRLGRKIEDLSSLMKRYEVYLSDRRELNRLSNKQTELSEGIERCKKQLEKIALHRKSLEEAQYLLKALMEKTEGKRRLYEPFECLGADGEKLIGGENPIDGESPVGGKSQAEYRGFSEEEIIRLESRYEAITGRISGEQTELEERLSKALKVYEKNRDELTHLEEKYGVSFFDYREILYSRDEKERIEGAFQKKQREKDRQDVRWREEDKEIALLAQTITRLYGEMLRDFEKAEPLPKEEIVLLDFEARRNQALQLLTKEKKRLEDSDRRLRGYEENLTALTEYNALKRTGDVEWEVDFSEISYRELGNFKGILVRDYNESVTKRRDKKDGLVRILNRVVRIEAFNEDFFKKPLESLLQLVDDAEQIILQLNTTLSSYENLMEKLDVDISMIEKEKEKIVEILEDYVKEVHRNLGRIDKNSTIPIRDRQIKMLKMQLPDWEENEQIYHIRLQDFMDEVTKKGIEILEGNENAAEYLGAKVTTKNLYDVVVGIGNVEIRLYKVEEKREYPITWAEVSKNSGGEGFLSAFVILNSLLYYMRKDDTDIFADRSEGKVLVMDNPFAQTNAAHLLKPLMDMAKKTDTQLICLSGLGGESIYSRFDNIYVLNLIAANLRNEMQYLKADHIRGSEAEDMILSQIEVVEQMELVF